MILEHNPHWEESNRQVYVGEKNKTEPIDGET